MSKVRLDYVTNSSSSSFIVSKNDATYDQLALIIKEIASRHVDDYDEDWAEEIRSNWDNVKNKYIGEDGQYEIISCKINDYEKCDLYDKYIQDGSGEFYKIDNNTYTRYNWSIIESVLDKYGIKFEYGYCD